MQVPAKMGTAKLTSSGFWMTGHTVNHMASIPSWPNLSQGNTGKNVSALQCLLNYRNNNTALAVDGSYTLPGWLPLCSRVAVSLWVQRVFARL